MKKNIIILLISSALVSLFYACDDTEIFDKEMYKNLIYIVSDEKGIFPLECNMDTNDSIVSFSIACGGSKHFPEDVTVSFAHDSTLFNRYNYTNFDIDSSKYIQHLSADKFRIPSYSTVLRKDADVSYSAVPIIIHPEDLYGLSPDSMYVIDLKISNISNYELNEDKRSVLCRVYFENKYARMKKQVNYSSKLYLEKEGESEKSYSVVKNPLPLTKNSVRVYVGTTALPAETKDFNPKFVNRHSVRITINNDNSLNISAYDETNEWLEVEMLTPSGDDPLFRYTNEYEEGYDQLTGLPAFKMYYKYRIKKDDGKWDSWHTVKEILLRLKDPAEK